MRISATPQSHPVLPPSHLLAFRFSSGLLLLVPEEMMERPFYVSDVRLLYGHSSLIQYLHAGYRQR